MKYAWKDSENNVRVMEVVSGSPEQFLPEGSTLLGVMPSTIADSDLGFLKAELVEEVPAIAEYWSKEGEANVYVDPQDETWTYHAAVEAIPAHYEISVDDTLKVNADKEARIKAAYDQMNVDVYAEMANVFGTTNADSANAYERTWNLMKSSPASFINVGVKNDSGVEFTVEQDVINYADAKIANVLAYGVWRMARIDQFRTLRASILAE